MKKPSIVIMAAGIGSRFGGLKQLAPVGLGGEAILEFSLYDALEAGFEKIVFIIKEELYEDFRALIGSSLDDKAEVHYVFQEQNMIPEGYEVPEGRAKPWGTGHAILCSKSVIDEPFAVINADDYYGKDAFQTIYNHLLNQEDDEKYRYSMVGYHIENTITDKGHVTRGVCQAEGRFLKDITERHRIELRECSSEAGNSFDEIADKRIQYTLDDGQTWTDIEKGTLVSMNLWGFTPSFLEELEHRFPGFLDRAIAENPLKEEFLLPTIVHELISEGKATVEILNSKDQWYGITYKEDLPKVQEALRSMQAQGLYPSKLFNK